MNPPDDPLRLGLTALEAGLIDAAQLGRLAFTLGQAPDQSMAALLTRLLGPRAVHALQAGDGTLDWGMRADPAHQVTLAPETVQDDGAPADAVPLGDMLALGLPPARFAQRYQVGDELGRGGVGVVVTAHDGLMGRAVAIKSLHGAAADAPERLARFVAEARTTAQLDHPNVVPVHDFGQLADGRPCFTMRRVRGRSLEAVLAGLAAGDPELTEQFSRYRLLQVLMLVCMAVDYAHSKGVVHRDLKPANIMVGDFGEVLVMDWGVAKVAGQSLVDDREERPVTVEASGSSSTLHGAIVGTPGYMPPEQARGEVARVDARSDVWALGALLYELLTGSRPVAGKSALAVLIKTVEGDIEPPRARAPERAIPTDLEEICLRALATEPADRYPSARALHSELEQYLAGTREQARRQEDADRLVADGDESLWYLRTLEAELGELGQALRAQPPLTGEEALAVARQRWAMEDRIDQLRGELDRAFHYARGKFLQATERVAGHAEARARLADLHWTRYREARAATRNREAEQHLKALARFQDQRAAQRLRDTVPLTLRTDPPGAQVSLHPVVERDRVLTPGAARDLGQTPLEAVAIPTGRQLLVIEAPGRRPVRLPLLVWPGDTPTFELPLPSEAALGEDFVYVPAGRFVRGNDPQAVLANPAGLVHVDPFAIQRFPVTVAEYFAFLDSLPPAQAKAHQPREARGGPLFPPPPDGRWRVGMVDVDGDVWPGEWAICAVSFHDAEAYAAWRSARDGVRYRLPTEDEWEKAARGTDGRRYPWGDHFHPTFCSNRTAPGPVIPQSVGHYPTDCSPYGVRDMAGGVREWNDAWFEAGQRVVRGGAFSLYPVFCRVAGRWGSGPRATQANYGFRLVKVL